MNPVGADRRVRLHVKHTPRPAHELKVDALLALRCANAAMVETHRFLGQRAPQEFSQVGAVRNIARRAVHELAPFAHRRRGDHPAVLPAPKLPGEFESNGKLVERLCEAEPSKRPNHVWGNDDACAELLEGGRLLINGDFEPSPPQEQCRRESAEPRADDGDFCRSHGRVTPFVVLSHSRERRARR
jgi:hypothetical protein